jgi:CBS domain-containing protein
MQRTLKNPSQFQRGKLFEYAIFAALVGGAMYVAAGFVGLLWDKGSTDSASQRRAIAGTTATESENGSADSRANDDFARQLTVRKVAATLSMMALGVLAWFVLYVRGREQHGTVDDAAFMGPNEVQRDAIFKKRQQILHSLSEHIPAVFAGDIQVQHLMSRRLTTVTPSTPAEDVQSLMKTNRLRHVLVCTSDNQLQGIISIKDANKGKTAAAMMTPNPFTVDPKSLLGPTITLLIHNRISCLPVTHKGNLIGIITTTDILMGMQGVMQILKKLVTDGDIALPQQKLCFTLAPSHTAPQGEADPS